MKLLRIPIPDIVEGEIETENGTVVTKKYIKGNFLGRGGFAKCYEFKDFDTGQVFAAKIIDKTSINNMKRKDKFVNEIKIHKYLEHPGIVKFQNSFEDSTNAYIILELCKNQTLKELVKRRKRLTELEAQCYLGQLITALIYLHNCNIIHRDLKLGNLFLAKNLELKVGDFGLAAELTRRCERRNTMCGTPNYVAPEILQQKETHKEGHSFEVDIWAVGIILYILLIGKPPFESANVNTTYRKIECNSYSIPDKPKLSVEAIELIKKILVPFPEKRPSLGTILQDPFMIRNSYPMTMPLPTLFNPPSNQFLSKYIATKSNLVSKAEKRRYSWYIQRSMRLKQNRLMSRTYIATLHLFPDKSLSISKEGKINSANSLREFFQPVFVDFYMDLINRYGTGYALTNGCLGFIFNNSTTLLTNQENKYTYHTKTTNTIFTSKKCPIEIKKKYIILLFFIHWYKNIRNSPKIKFKRHIQNEIMVKKVVKTAKGLLFKLNNQSVQMCFNDMTTIVVCYKMGMFLYINQRGEIEAFEIGEVSSYSRKETLLNKLDYIVRTVKTLNSLHRHKLELFKKLKKS